MKILLLSNGHAEDLAAAGIGIELKKLLPDCELTALPLVGLGKAYDKAGIKNLGLKKLLPSGGFAKEGPLFFLKDLLAGWLRIFLSQVQLLRELGRSHDLIVGVGDAYLVALAGFFGRKPLVFVDGPKSVRIAGYWPLELWLMKKFCRQIIVQDKETAAYLQGKGLPALYLGTWVMDYVPVTGDDFNLPAGEKVIGILPGTREEAYDNLGLILDILSELKEEKFTGLIASTLDRQKLEDKGLLSRIESFPQPLRLIEGKFGDVCVNSTLIIGLAGIANEQAAGFGKPVVCFPGRGPQTTLRRWKEIQKITGDSMLILQGSPSQIANEIRALLHSPERLAKMGQLGRASKPDWGGLKNIAGLVAEVLNAC